MVYSDSWRSSSSLRQEESFQHEVQGCVPLGCVKFLVMGELVAVFPRHLDEIQVGSTCAQPTAVTDRGHLRAAPCSHSSKVCGVNQRTAAHRDQIDTQRVQLSSHTIIF